LKIGPHLPKLVLNIKKHTFILFLIYRVYVICRNSAT